MHIGNKQLFLEQVTSTNDIAWHHASNAEHDGLMVVACEQTAGRGRRGDLWLSPPGSALYLSMLLHPDLAYRRPVMLTIWAGLGVCRMIERTLALKPQLKWPNDVLIQGKKVCGILVEQRQEWFVVGVGINVHVPIESFQHAGINQAGSLADFTQQPLNRLELLTHLQTEWNELFVMLTSGKNSQLLGLWHSYNGLIGQFVKLEARGKQLTGKLRLLSWDEITIESDDKLIALPPEVVTKVELS